MAQNQPSADLFCHDRDLYEYFCVQVNLKNGEKKHLQALPRWVARNLAFHFGQICLFQDRGEGDKKHEKN